MRLPAAEQPSLSTPSGRTPVHAVGEGAAGARDHTDAGVVEHVERLDHALRELERDACVSATRLDGV